MPTAEELATHICEEIDGFLTGGDRQTLRSWDGFLDRLNAKYLQSEPDQGFHTLLSILATNERFSYQNAAGQLLLKYAIACKIGLDDFLAILLNNFNLSASNTVLYIRNTFGDDAVLLALEQWRKQQLPKEQRTRLEGIMYFCGKHPLDEGG